MTDRPPTELGENILKLMELYMAEMRRRLILKAAFDSGKTSITIGESFDLEESVRRVLVEIFEAATDELIAGKDPQSVLRTFLQSRGK